MSRNKLATARELIQERKFAEARALLLTMPDDSTAREWLAKLDRMAGPTPGIATQTLPFAERTQKRKGDGWIKWLGVFAAGFVLGVVVGSPGRDGTRVASAPTASKTATEGPSPTATEPPLPTATFTASATITDTAVPTVTSTATATFTATTTPTLTATEAPLVFSGNADQVVGPVTIPAGTYRARVTTAGYIIVEINPTQGECGAGTGLFLNPGLFILSEGQAASGAEAVLTSEGCATLIAVSNVSAPPWSLELEKIS